MSNAPKLRQYHAAVWDEPLVMELGAPGRRGVMGPTDEPAIAQMPAALPQHLQRNSAPSLPEISEFEALRHYEHLSQQILGMMGISLFGTCTMKYNPRVNERLVSRADLAEVHPLQHEETLQGILEIFHRFDVMLREVSGMDKFVFQAGGGADAAYL